MKHIILFESFVSESDWYTVNKPGWDTGKTSLGSVDHLKRKGANVPFKEKEMVMLKDDFYNKMPGQIINVFHNENTGEVFYGIRFFNQNGTTSLGKEKPEDLKLLEIVPDYVKNHSKFEK